MALVEAIYSVTDMTLAMPDVDVKDNITDINRVETDVHIDMHLDIRRQSERGAYQPHKRRLPKSLHLGCLCAL